MDASRNRGGRFLFSYCPPSTLYRLKRCLVYRYYHHRHCEYGKPLLYLWRPFTSHAFSAILSLSSRWRCSSGSRDSLVTWHHRPITETIRCFMKKEAFFVWEFRSFRCHATYRPNQAPSVAAPEKFIESRRSFRWCIYLGMNLIVSHLVMLL